MAFGHTHRKPIFTPRPSLPGLDLWVGGTPRASIPCRQREGQKPLPPGYPAQPKTLGEQLRKQRMDLGLGQRELAKQLGVSKSSIENWEGNDVEPPRWMVPRIREFLGLQPSQRFRGALSRRHSGPSCLSPKSASCITDTPGQRNGLFGRNRK